jgi:putative SOS response-associated peptidase YedK
MADDSLFALDGLWDRWKDPAGKVIESCAILTTEANALLEDIHDRMPVILQPGDHDLWLDPGMTDPTKVIDLLQLFDARRMRVYPASSMVNKVEKTGLSTRKNRMKSRTPQISRLYFELLSYLWPRHH